MKALKLFFAAIAISLLVACTGMIPTATFNDKAALGERTVLLIQTNATAALRANKLNVDSDAAIQKQLEVLHTGIKTAKALQLKDPVAAAADLTSVLKQLDIIKERVGVTP